MSDFTEASFTRACQGLESVYDAAAALNVEQRFEEELAFRLDICRHPQDLARHSVLRVQNLAMALRIVLSVDREHLSPETLKLARELLEAIRLTPVMTVGSEDHNGPLTSWERCMRLLLETIDLDLIVGLQPDNTDLLPVSFMSSGGTEIDILDVAAGCDKRAVRAVFFTASSPEYFRRYGETYVSSVLANCDCSCLVLVCLCAPRERLAEIVAGISIDDPRLIFCSDDFDPGTRPAQIIHLGGGEPDTVNFIYYAAAALMRVDGLLLALGRPIFVTGIDTVLQRGIADLIEGFSDADLVLNKCNSGLMLGSQLVNNLVLFYPTPNGVQFARFLKTYLGLHVSKPIQPEFLDQLDLHMAKHHLMACGDSPIIQYFGEFDINNLMFNHINYQPNRELMNRFRFLNMFVGAFGAEKRLLVGDLVPAMV